MVYSVQYLRGIAAFMVLLEHVGVKSTQHSTNLLSSWHIGGAGVDLFFLISGFIMCHTTATKHQQTGASRQFLWRRVLRIIPLYWLVTCAALLIFLVMPDKINSGGGETGVFASFFLLPTDQLYLVSNGWTLRYEFLFYFVFMLGLFFNRWFGQALVITLLLGMVWAGQWLAPQSAVGRFVTDALLLEFVGGMLLYHAFHALKKLKDIRIPLAFACLGVAFGSLLAVNAGVSSGLRVVDFGVPMVFLMLGALYLEPLLERQPIGFLKMLGDSSYAMYLVHPFVLAGGAMVMNKLQLSHTLHGVLFAVSLVGLSILIGYLIYAFVEKPLGKTLSNVKLHSSKPEKPVTDLPMVAQKT